MGRVSRSVLVLGIVMVALAGAAFALGSSLTSGRITVCVSQKGGALYRAKSCAKRDTKLSWNARGVAGPRGATGAAGPQGPAGAQGAKGDIGSQGSKGDTGTQGATGIGTAALYGDGSDGEVTINSGTTILSRDMYYHNLTLAPGAILYPNGDRIFVSGTLTLGNGANITADANGGSGGSGGAGGATGTHGGGGFGGNGGVINVIPPIAGATESNSLGGAGDGSDGGGGSVTLPAAAAGGTGVFRQALAAISGRSLDGMIVNGGGGGGGGAGGGGLGGGGGGGGGVVIIAARTITVTGSALITARGGATGAPTGGNSGGGGGGGVVVVVTDVSQPAGIILSAVGGAGSGHGAAGFSDWLN
jgi:hypothetical protein